MPIDPNFRSNCKAVSAYQNIAIWQNGESKLGIYGTEVAVDFDLCVGDGACIDVCPVNVFEWYEQKNSEKKAAPVRERDCIYCMGCEAVCPKFAIRVNPLLTVK